MIITCQNCHKRYQVEDKSIKADGRKVRCVACQHEWTQKPETKPEQKQKINQTKRPEIRHLANKKPPVLPTYNPTHFPVGWTCFIACLAITIGLFWGARETIIKSWPETRPLYKTLGMTLPTPGQGLVIENSTVMHIQDKDKPYLVVRGEIRNSTDQVIALPALQLNRIGAGKKHIASSRRKHQTCPMCGTQFKLLKCRLHKIEKQGRSKRT